MPGPAPKPAARRQRRNTPSLGVVLPGPKAAAPPAALKEWLPATKKAWKELLTSPLAKAYNLPTDLPALQRLFSLRDDRERYRLLVRSSTFVEGSMGQLRLNPLMAEISKIDSEIRQLEDRFGLNAAARLKLGITLGEAARSLDDLNKGLYGDEGEDDQGDEPDPRLADAEDGRTIDARSRQA